MSIGVILYAAFRMLKLLAKVRRLTPTGQGGEALLVRGDPELFSRLKPAAQCALNLRVGVWYNGAGSSGLRGVIACLP